MLTLIAIDGISGAGKFSTAKRVAANSQAPHVLGFVHAFLAVNPDSLFVKIRKGDADVALRIAVQKDSLATKSPADLAGPLKAKLDSARLLVGGCWRNYP